MNTQVVVSLDWLSVNIRVILTYVGKYLEKYNIIDAITYIRSSFERPTSLQPLQS